jgi:low affinity Fe/Cu permease
MQVKIETIVSTIMKLQHKFVTQSKKDRFNLEGIIKGMKHEIEASVGAQMSQEIEGLLAGMGGMLEENFG